MRALSTAEVYNFCDILSSPPSHRCFFLSSWSTLRWNLCERTHAAETPLWNPPDNLPLLLCVCAADARCLSDGYVFC